MTEENGNQPSLFAKFSSWRSDNAEPSLLDNVSNSLSSSYNEIYQRLPLHNGDLENTKFEEPSWFKLSKFERLALFLMFIAASVICFTLGIILFPVLILKPIKFVLLWVLGSFLFILSFGCLQGPYNYFKHLVSKDRLPFTIIFFGSNLITFYAAIGLKSTILTIIGGIISLIAMLYYTLSYFPFGAQGFQMITTVGLRQFSSIIGL
ncbi:hypothetical protein PACTADRAFT_48233 [Pachysolen tannophilus NRRL Y-2460]|uniref:Protein transport protein SFT2 n=1 Tax=Pachysolen tannophilus NRRL Y-2460 TaxID=669874 RepID=A0A1E4U3B2_PACTA|nr:hypothetical protein PACTADRAFT_48233 [Pachysolen tannophilus NRRL Y-2460]